VVRQALHLIQDHRLIGVALKKQRRLYQPSTDGGGFEIEVEAGLLGCDLQRQGGLAHLARAQQRHGRELLQPLPQQRRLLPDDPGTGRISLQIRHDVPELQGKRRWWLAQAAQRLAIGSQHLGHQRNIGPVDGHDGTARHCGSDVVIEANGSLAIPSP